METRKQNEKIITVLIAGVVLVLAVFSSEFRSYGESANTMVKEIGEFVDADLRLEGLIEVESFEIEGPMFKTAKLYNEKGELLEMLIMMENETIEEVYAGKRFNKAEFLTAYGDTSVYQVTE